MSSIQLINSVMSWERRLEIEEDKRRYYRIQPFYDAMPESEPQLVQKQSKSLIESILGRLNKNKPMMTSRKEKPCKDPQPC